jgi:queuine tRNA-ribosyltransferase
MTVSDIGWSPQTRETPFAFQLTAGAEQGRARGGRLVTGHGDIDTPVFMPVGTAGSVKAMTFESLWDSGTRLILGNTYHLYLRPGHELIAAAGGLHRFQGWDGALLTDSAGFQVFSLASLNEVSEEGVAFQSHLDGSRHFFTPELSMEVQLALGADIVMAFDHCVPYGASREEITVSVSNTTAWARRCQQFFGGRCQRDGWERVLFGIVQGEVQEAERRRSADALVSLDLPGYAIGGLSVGEPFSARQEMTELTAQLLPAAKPRYLMGVGFPDDILAAVGQGIDMFDCVLPTRMARTGTLLTRDGRLVVKNSAYAQDHGPPDGECGCPVCQRHTRAYLRHLFNAHEILASVLATTHNLYFYQELMMGIRRALREGNFADFAQAATARWRAGEQARREEIERSAG